MEAREILDRAPVKPLLRSDRAARELRRLTRALLMGKKTPFSCSTPKIGTANLMQHSMGDRPLSNKRFHVKTFSGLISSLI
jgi:hypothetical protein